MTRIAHWNIASTNTAFGSIVRVGLRGEWGSDALRMAFTIDGVEVPTKQAVARLRRVPVLDWVVDAGIPPTWSVENRAILAGLVKSVYKSLGGWWGLSKAYRATIRHVTDFENYTQSIDRSVPRLSDAGGAHFAVTFAHVMGQCLKGVGFTGPAANYAMAHGPECQAVGGPPFSRITPFHCPGAMDGRTAFITGYVDNVSDKCYEPAEIIDAIRGAAWPDLVTNGEIWLALSADYQPGLESVLAAAVDYSVDLVLLWGDTDRRKVEPNFGPSKDAKIARFLAAAGWKGNG